ncbi:peptide-methionine (R)-S-oxide reductase MsrB, partial [Rufibacter ruber]|uniref:peptide-methionine (R)-S-oxide reductase MsrB n=1 Tax=Rufibacter ruber TaxID=1783499 RepID=UPI000A4166AA
PRALERFGFTNVHVLEAQATPDGNFPTVVYPNPGRYVCAACGSLLFHAATKYHAISGWPSFTQPASKGAIKYLFDNSHRMQRIEVQCNVCDGHLGHVFPDGPEPFGLRYCINSESLARIEETDGSVQEASANN